MTSHIHCTLYSSILDSRLDTEVVWYEELPVPKVRWTNPNQ